MTLRASIPLLVLAAVSAISCNRDQQRTPVSTTTTQTAPNHLAAASEDAPMVGTPASAADTELVKQAVQDHLRNNKGINMSAMDLTVESVTVDGDRAQANATFKVKGGGATMAMIYSLERHGNGWLVLKSQPSNGEFVHPPMDKLHSGAAAPASPASAPPDVTDFLKNHPAAKSN
jgi:hypothetical protein